jgi:HSP20 family protein
MNRVRDEMDRMFGRYTGRRFPLVASSYPLLNISEDDDRVYVEAELPGMEMSDLEILVHGNQLSIKGERLEPSGEDKQWHRRERGYGKFTRVVELPFDPEQSKVEAEFRNGVLSITLPKREEWKPRRIEVKVN